MKNLIIIGTLLLLLSACTPDPLVIDIPQREPELVVYSQVLPGQGMVVYLAKSFSALAYNEQSGDPDEELLNQLLVQDGLVSVEYEGVVYAFTNIGTGIYGSLEIPIDEGGIYHLRAEDLETGKSVSSTEDMKPFSNISAVTAETGPLDNDLMSVNIDLEFEDPDGENYYIATFNEENPLESGIELNGLGESSSIVSLLTDQNAVNGSIEASFSWIGIEQDTLYMSLSSISRSYYEFLNQRQDAGGIVDAIIGEPISYTTNIEGGFGFFHLSLPDYEIIPLTE